jgi:hypothetical protein
MKKAKIQTPTNQWHIVSFTCALPSPMRRGRRCSASCLPCIQRFSPGGASRGFALLYKNGPHSHGSKLLRAPFTIYHGVIHIQKRVHGDGSRTAVVLLLLNADFRYSSAFSIAREDGISYRPPASCKVTRHHSSLLFICILTLTFAKQLILFYF